MTRNRKWLVEDTCYCRRRASSITYAGYVQYASKDTKQHIFSGTRFMIGCEAGLTRPPCLIIGSVSMMVRSWAVKAPAFFPGSLVGLGPQSLMASKRRWAAGEPVGLNHYRIFGDGNT